MIRGHISTLRSGRFASIMCGQGVKCVSFKTTVSTHKQTMHHHARFVSFMFPRVSLFAGVEWSGVEWTGLDHASWTVQLVPAPIASHIDCTGSP